MIPPSLAAATPSLLSAADLLRTPTAPAPAVDPTPEPQVPLGREPRICAARFCNVRFTPRRDGQLYCGRPCSFKSLHYSKHRDLWREIVASRGYTPRYGRKPDDDT